MELLTAQDVTLLGSLDKLTAAHENAAKTPPPYAVRKQLREATLRVGRTRKEAPRV